VEIEPISDTSPIYSVENEPLKKQPFISAILYIKEMIRKLLDGATHPSAITDDSSSSLFSTYYSGLTPVSIDTLHFGIFLYEHERLKEEGRFYQTIADRREELRRQKEHWIPFIARLKDNDQEFYNNIQQILMDGKLIPNPSGAGGAYFLTDRHDEPRFIVKPVDEDILCLNNRKEFGSIFNDYDHRVREGIPLYRSAQTDAFCSEMASLAGVEGATPKTTMGLIANQVFYDFTQWIEEADREKFFNEAGFPDKEKLASIQEFIPDSQDLIELLHSFYQKELSDEEIASQFDQTDFEEVCLFLWLSYDNDGHGANFRSYVKSTDKNGKKIYGIKKIDNGLSFPEKNSEYVNILAWLPNAIAPLSDEIKNKIAHLPVEQILNRMDDFELSDCKDAFKERVEILKQLAKREGMTAGEIDLRFSILSYEEGKELALSPMTTQEILDLLHFKNTESLAPFERLRL
jgi:hypothetical protein